MAECEFCETTHKVMVPCVHLNGTSTASLLEDIQAAANAVYEAIQRVVTAAPNGRDYYVYREQDATQRVMNEHRSRLEKLNAVLFELMEMRDHVQSVLDFREAERRSWKTPTPAASMPSRSPR